MPPSSSARSRIDRATFLALLRQSGLLTAEELAKVVPALPRTDDARALALALIARGVLTRYQAARLLLPWPAVLAKTLPAPALTALTGSLVQVTCWHIATAASMPTLRFQR